MTLTRCVLPRWSAHVNGFTLPHFMFWCNTPVVHASAACVSRPSPPPPATAAADADAATAPPAATVLCFRDAMLLPYCDRWFTLWGLLPLLATYAALLLLSPAWLLLAAPPVKRTVQRALLGSYSYAGAKTARTLFRIHAAGEP